MMPPLEGRFELLRQVGEGGFGAVYQALDRVSGAHVAVKLAHASNEVDASRFEREVALLAELKHPSVVRYVGHGRAENGRRYLVMEWLEGQTLAARLRVGWLSIGELVLLAQRMIAGLWAAERIGIVHRDIKPANLFLPGGRISEAKILDFGLARRMTEAHSLTRSGLLLGTPLYMSPEQARGLRNLGPASDTFSMGSVLFEALCGVPAFAGDTAMGTLARICFEEPESIESLRSNVPDEVVAVLQSMLDKERDKRPSYAALTDDWTRVASHLSACPVDESESVPVKLASEELMMTRALKGALRSRAQQRVLCAVFVGHVSGELDSRATTPELVEQRLDAMLHRYRARSEAIHDGSLVLFLEERGTPTEQATAAARCALATRDLLPDSAIALCIGRAVLEGSLPYGEIMEMGLELLRETPAGVVRLDEASAGLLEARFELRGAENRRVLERERSGGEVPRTLLGQVTPFVGRERELGQMELTFRECVDEDVARTIVVVAPAGAGKSRLRFELVQRLRRFHGDFTLLGAVGDSVRTRTPFAALAPAIRGWAGIEPADSADEKQEKLRRAASRGLAPERAPVVAAFLGEMLGVHLPEHTSPELRAARRDPKLMGDRIAASWLEWLDAECRLRPVVVFLEDLHWADPATLSFLEAAMRNLADKPFLVIAFTRPEVRERFPNLWAQRELQEIRLPKLGTRPCERLLDAVVGAELSAERRAWLIERADGNPFFLEELIRNMRAGGDTQKLPDTVLGTIQTRLDALGEDAKLLLRAASVFGEVFRTDAVLVLFGDHAAHFDLPGWLNVLCESELVHARSGEEYGFRHALIRDAAYASLPEAERHKAHRLAAEWLLAQGSGDAALLASHFERAQELDRAAPAYRDAAKQAFDASALDAAIRLGERAVACGAQGELLGEVAAIVAAAYAWGDNQVAAEEWAIRARGALAPGADAWWLASQVLAIAIQFRSPEDNTIALELIHAAEEDGAASFAELSALAILATNCFGDGQNDIALKLLTVLETKPLENLPPRVLGKVENARQRRALTEKDFPEAIRHGHAALDAHLRGGTVHDILFSMLAVGDVLTMVGAYDQADTLLKESAVRSQGHGSYELTISLGLATIELRRGNWSRAREMLARCVAGFTKAGITYLAAEALALLGEAHLMGGDLEPAAEYARQAVATPTAPARRALALSVHARILLLLKRPDEALAASREAASLVEVHPDFALVSASRRVLIECLLVTGKREEAREVSEEARALLLQAAAHFEDDEDRRRWLSVVPDNARILELARGLAPVPA
ncbi:MAG: protein kinase [Myxococcales bacterium]